jgi:hypothetical protein
MGYAFSFEQPGLPNHHYSMNDAQMSILLEVMREVKAIREQGCNPNWTLLPDGVTQAKFRSNDNHHVTPAECLLIAERLRVGLKDGTVIATLSVIDDAPHGKKGVAWIEKWIDYNERAAAAGGYRVR